MGLLKWFYILQNDTELRNPNSLCSTGLALRWFVEVQTEVSHLWLHIFFPRIWENENWGLRVQNQPVKPSAEKQSRSSWQLALKSKYSYTLLVWIKFYWNTTILIGPDFICIVLSTMTKLNSLIRNHRAYNICFLFLVNKFYYFVAIQLDIYFTLYVNHCLKWYVHYNEISK